MKNRLLLMAFLGLGAFAGASATNAISLRVNPAVVAQTQQTQLVAQNDTQVLALGRAFEKVAATVSPAVVSVESS